MESPNRYSTTATIPREALSFRDVLSMLHRNKLWIFVAAATGVAVAAAVVYRQQPVYRAAAVVRLVDVRRAVTGGIDEGRADDPRKVDPTIAHVRTLRSRVFLGAVVDREGLALIPLTAGAASVLSDVAVSPEARSDTLELRFRESGMVAEGGFGTVEAAYGSPVALPPVTFTVAARPTLTSARLVVMSREQAIDRLLGSLTVRAQPNSDIIDVELVARDPVVAQRSANAIVRMYQDLSADASQDQARRRRTFLAEQLKQNDSMLVTAQLALSQLRSREAIFSSRDMFAAQQANLTEVELRRRELAADRRVLGGLLEDFEKSRGSGDGEALRTLVSMPSINANPVVSQLYGQLVRHRAVRDSLRTGPWRSAANSPDVVRQNELIASTEGMLAGAVRSHIASLDARLAALESVRSGGTQAMQALSPVEATEVRLVQQVESARSMGDRLREDLQRAGIAVAVDAGQVEIVDLAALPRAPVGSMRTIFLCLGLLLGTAVGVGGAVLREVLNPSVRMPQEMEGLLRVPTLALLPPISGAGQPRRRLLGGGSSRSRVPGGSKATELLDTAGDPLLPSFESYRLLRSSILWQRREQALRTLVITSAAAAEGKTTVASNLAVTFAREGMRVLLIDCDTRRPRVHGVFSVRREPGLTDLLAGNASVREVITSTSYHNLYVIPSGAAVASQNEAIRGNQVSLLLHEAAAQFDLVLLDTAPLGAVADAALLGAEADGVLVVARAGKTDRTAIQQVVQQLERVGARVIGTVLNDPEAVVPSYNSYYGYADSSPGTS